MSNWQSMLKTYEEFSTFYQQDLDDCHPAEAVQLALVRGGLMFAFFQFCWMPAVLDVLEAFDSNG